MVLGSDTKTPQIPKLINMKIAYIKGFP